MLTADIPKSFLKAIGAWRSAQQSSGDTVASLGQHLAHLVDGGTNLYLTNFDSDTPDRFGFQTLVGNFDTRVKISKHDVLGNYPDRRHVNEDLVPQYQRASLTGELRHDSLRGKILGRFVHYDRVILPITPEPGKQPSHALSLSKARFIIEPGEGDTKSLSDREHEIFSLIASGMTTKEIARELNASPRTIEAHLNAIKQKTGANNITHAVALHLLRSTF